jgi:hypothetical protein
LDDSLRVALSSFASKHVNGTRKLSSGIRTRPLILGLDIRGQGGTQTNIVCSFACSPFANMNKQTFDILHTNKPQAMFVCDVHIVRVRSLCSIAMIWKVYGVVVEPNPTLTLNTIWPAHNCQARSIDARQARVLIARRAL